jgi:hypothetical protein
MLPAASEAALVRWTNTKTTCSTKNRVVSRAACAALLLAVLCLAVLQVGEAVLPLARAEEGRNRRAEESKPRELGDNDRFSWIHAVGDNGMIMTSRNAGDTWLPLESGTSENLYDVMFADARKGLVVGDNSVLLKSENMGEEWESVELPVVKDKKTALYGVFIMTWFGETVIVGDKGLFIESEDMDTWCPSTLVCTVAGSDCVQQPFHGDDTSKLVLVGARFSNPDTGIIIGSDGSVIVVSGATGGGGRRAASSSSPSSAADDTVVPGCPALGGSRRGGGGGSGRVFHLLKPVQVNGRLPDFWGISADVLGDVVVAGQYGVVLLNRAFTRQQDSNVNWYLTNRTKASTSLN